MSLSVGAAAKPVTSAMRRLLLLASCLVFIIGIPLFVLPERTAEFFAWTVNPPLTAAFLGAAYWASFFIEFLSSRQAAWARARLAVPAVFAFTALTLLATLLHLDKFHFGRHLPISAQAMAWVWLAVYGSVPIIMAAVWARQVNTPGGDMPRAMPLAPWTRWLMLAQAAVLLALGVGLLLLPRVFADCCWPWPLTALTSRAVGAWLVGLGLAAGHMAWENDWRRSVAGVAGYLAFSLLQLAALARFFETFDWGGVLAWLYLTFLLGLLAVGFYGWLASRDSAKQYGSGSNITT